MTTKVCTKCGIEKDLSNFGKDSSRPDGLKYNCKSCKKKQGEAWFQENKARRSKTNGAWYKRNKAEKAKKAKVWQKSNKHKVNAISAKYRSAKLQRTPKWLTEEQEAAIEMFYLQAKDCEAVSGQMYHVDHIVPLQGENVSGLHVPWNLQVLPSDVNITKSNKYDPDSG